MVAWHVYSVQSIRLTQGMQQYAQTFGLDIVVAQVYSFKYTRLLIVIKSKLIKSMCQVWAPREAQLSVWKIQILQSCKHRLNSEAWFVTQLVISKIKYLKV